jgi:hypothetical protein
MWEVDWDRVFFALVIFIVAGATWGSSATVAICVTRWLRYRRRRRRGFPVAMLASSLSDIPPGAGPQCPTPPPPPRYGGWGEG